LEENVHNTHDKGYKYLFSIKRLFVQLLRSFVNQGWAQKISPEDVELVDKSFILPDFKDKEADLVYKIKMDGGDVYFYLLELQSTVDYQMPYRLLLYMVEIWRTVLKDTASKEAERKDFKLPVIVPCVLYNGNDNWTAVKSFRETLARHEEFDEFVLDFKYILFDVRRYNDEDLLNLANVIGAAFFIDKTKDKANDLLGRLEAVAKRMQGLSDDDVEVLWTWLKNIAARGLPKEKENEIEEIFQKERKVLNMVYAIERVMQQERVEAEEVKAIEIAKEMLIRKMDVEIVSQITKLPIETIKELAKELEI
jgi:predicted transposase/invertase (TIGR01784 family)